LALALLLIHLPKLPCGGVHSQPRDPALTDAGGYRHCSDASLTHAQTRVFFLSLHEAHLSLRTAHPDERRPKLFTRPVLDQLRIRTLSNINDPRLH